MSAPKRSAIRPSAGLPAATTARAARSASATTMPSASKRRVTSLLPAAMPPVRPTTYRLMGNPLSAGRSGPDTALPTARPT
ncbi:hypothetical protein G6F35_018556 [Rhizopus arrhizus]|nr:hypothetical protein G6F35_018556 [Rhizopus arrhizus]